VISGFHRQVDENCTLLGYYAASSGNNPEERNSKISWLFRLLEVSLKMSGITELKVIGIININLLKTQRILLYIRNQSIPRCKHFPPWL